MKIYKGFFDRAEIPKLIIRHTSTAPPLKLIYKKKRCSTCKKYKPATHEYFNCNKVSKVINSSCRLCMKKYVKNWCKENKERRDLMYAKPEIFCQTKILRRIFTC